MRRRFVKPEPVPNEKVLQIAQSKGYFDVSLRWRDDALRRRCFKLKKQGKLRGGHRVGREQRFYPVPKEDQTND